VRFHPFEKDIRKENTSERSRHFVPGYDHSVPPGRLIGQRVLNIGRGETNKGRLLKDSTLFFAVFT
jgi:hypothetical protein